ncbi:MAG: Rnf-Nqr domain containing protein [Bacilli bacterium]|nr:Rnf-Nqr domain containing protein [Bacilli bacterium]
MTLKIALGILLAGILSNNYAVLKFLGTGAVIENNRSIKKSLIIGAGTTIVMLITTLITWPINKYLLAKVEYLQTIVFVLVVLVVVEIVHLISKKKLEGFCQVDFLTFAINGAVLGLCINGTLLGFVEAIITSVAVGIGLTITMIIFSTLHERIDEEAVPNAFRGIPISLLIAGMMALAFLAF